jgi:hypothetical protein
MKPLDIIKQAEETRFEDENGYIEEFKMLPPLTPEEFRQLEARIPCPLPSETRELLEYCRGFDGVLESIDFSGLYPEFGMEEVFPHGVPIAHDGFGNYWVVDLSVQTETWSPIFLSATMLRWSCFKPTIWPILSAKSSNWALLTCQQGLQSGDPDLVKFAENLDDSWWMIDLREAAIGDGFSWGRYGPATVNRRFGEKRIFAVQKKKTLLQRMFNR